MTTRGILHTEPVFPTVRQQPVLCHLTQTTSLKEQVIALREAWMAGLQPWSAFQLVPVRASVCTSVVESSPATLNI